MNNWYPNLVGKTHPEVERAITQLYEAVQKFQPQLNQIQTAIGSVSTSGSGISRLSATDITKIATELSSSGSSPLNVGSLIGQLSQPQKALAPVSSSSGTPVTPVVPPSAGTLVVQNGELFYFDTTTLPGSFKPISAQAIILYDTYANWTATNYPPANYPLGTLFAISDWDVIYIVESIASVNTWVYLVGINNAPIASQPTTGFNGAALGASDTNLRFLATDTFLEYFWSGSAWVELAPTMGGATYPANDINGTFPNPLLNNTGVSAGTYGDATHTVTIQVDAHGRVVSISINTISSSPTGAAGGRLAGTYPNPSLANTLVTAGTYGSGTQVAQFNVNADGTIEIVANVTITGMPGFTGTLAAAITAGKSVSNGIIQP